MGEIHWPAKPPRKPNFDRFKRYSRISSLLAQPAFKSPITFNYPKDFTPTSYDASPPAYLLRPRERFVENGKPARASFLGLPLELREMIYDSINAKIPTIKPITSSAPIQARLDFAGNGLLQVSRQIHHEYNPIILRTMKIRLDILGSSPQTKHEKKILRKASHLTIWTTLSVGDDYRSRELATRYEEQVATWCRRLCHNTRLKSLRILITQACFTKCLFQNYPYDSHHECAHLEAFEVAARQLGNVKVSGYVSLKWDPTFQASPACVWQSRKFLNGIKKEMMVTSQ